MAFNDSTLNTSGSVWIKAYTPDGFQVSLTLPALTVADAMRHIEDVRAHGLLTTLPVDGGLESGESAETITMAVKRMKKNRKDELRPVIDVYWDGAGFKFVTIYLDTDEQIADFEAVSGLKVKDMPKYPSTAPLTAGDEETREFEVKVKTPFIVVRKPADKEVKINDKMVRPWDFVRYGTLAAQPAPAAKPAPVNEHAFDSRKPDTRAKKADAVVTIEDAPKPNGKKAAVTVVDDSCWPREDIQLWIDKWEAKEVKRAELKAALGVQYFDDFCEGEDAADALVNAYLNAEAAEAFTFGEVGTVEP